VSVDDAAIGSAFCPGGRRTRDAGATRWSASISVVIPTLNEAQNLPHVLTRIPAIVDEVVLVDGHSIDATIAIARAVRPDVRVVLQDGRGKGNAHGVWFRRCLG
jgi:glycosyltransferase involved in cell wall biosynthesis